MPETERPKSRLANGKMNPAYAKWRKAQKVAETPVAVMESPQVSGELDSSGAHIPASAGSIPAPATILTLKCIKAAKNPKFVFCDLGGVKVPVRCKRGLSKKMPGKRIKVSVDNSGATPIYTHIR